MLVRALTQNMSHGGKRINDDASRDRREALIDRIGPARADVVILNEATGFDDDDEQPARDFASELGLEVAGVTPSKSENPTCVLYRKETLGEVKVWDTKHNYLASHGFGVATWDVGLPEPLAVGAIHVTPFSPVQATIEVQTLVCRAYRYGPFALVGGDFNFPPLYGRAPDISQMRPYNRANRLVRPRDPDPATNTVVAQALYDGGFDDVAALLHQRGGSEDLLVYTGITERVDWIAVSQPLVGAVESYERLTQPLGASDHEGVVATIDIEKIDTSNPWSYQ